LPLDQSNQSDSPNGKITPTVLFPLMPYRHFRSSHASATSTCEQRRPKQIEGKDQASDSYK